MGAIIGQIELLLTNEFTVFLIDHRRYTINSITTSRVPPEESLRKNQFSCPFSQQFTQRIFLIFVLFIDDTLLERRKSKKSNSYGEYISIKTDMPETEDKKASF